MSGTFKFSMEWVWDSCGCERPFNSLGIHFPRIRVLELLLWVKTMSVYMDSCLIFVDDIYQLAYIGSIYDYSIQCP